MKACHITTVHPVFDIRIFQKQAKTLAQVGYDVRLVAQNDRDETVDHVKIIRLPRAKNRLERILISTWRAFFLALKQRADIYHFHDFEFLPFALLLQKISGRPVIYDVHEYYADSVFSREWIPTSLQWVVYKVVDRVEKLIAGKLSGIVTVNRHMEGLFKRVNSNTVAVHNYPLLDFYYQANTALHRESHTIIFIGSMSRIHGYQNMIKAMCSVRKQYPTAICIILGDLDRTNLPQDILKIENELLRDGTVRLLGRVPYDKIPQYLMRATISWIPWLAVPNNMMGTPTKLFECMSAGLPVVASRMHFIREVLEETNCGLLVDPDNPDDHARAILYLLNHPRDAKKMGEKGKNEVLKKYNWESESKELLKLYKQLLPGNDLHSASSL